MKKKLSLPLLLGCLMTLSSCQITGDFLSALTSDTTSLDSQTSITSNTTSSNTTSSSKYPGNTKVYYNDDDGNDKYYLAFQEESQSLVVGEKIEPLIYAYHDDLTVCSKGESHVPSLISSDESIVKIVDGSKMLAVAPGTCEVYYDANYKDYIWDTLVVTVSEKTLESVSISKGRTDYLKGSTVTFQGKVVAHYEGGFEEEIEDYTVNYSSVNNSIAGTYPLTISYTYNGVTKSITHNINICNEMGVNKATMDYDLEDYYASNWKTICPSSGNIKALVIPVWFSDSSSYMSSSKKSNVIADLNTAFFGTKAQCGQDSVKSYYETESHGKITLTGKVSSFYEPGQASTYYTSSNYATLAKNAVDWYFTNNPSDSRTNYDIDGDGVLDFVSIIYGRTSQTRSGDAMPVYWPKVVKQSVSSPSASSPKLGHFMWATYADMYSANTETENRIGTNKGTGNNDNCTLDTHTFKHESGHMFGLEDLYNYGSNSYYPAGHYSMQDNNKGTHDPFSLLALGWVNAYVPQESATFDLLDFASSGQVVLLTPKFNDSPFDEYLLLELYSPTGINEFDATIDKRFGFSQGIEIPGIRVWHVDARLTKYLDGSYSTTLYTDPTVGTMYFAMSNSYNSSKDSPLGTDYIKYNLLQYIRNDVEETTYGASYIDEENMFLEGDTFKMSTYKSQFVNSTYLNSGKSLGWEFSVNTLTSSFANISVKKV